MFKINNCYYCFQIIFNHIINSFKQVSDTLQCTNKMNELKICRTFASHETTRKYLLTNFLDIKFDFLKLLHHKPAEEKFIDVCMFKYV